MTQFAITALSGLGRSARSRDVGGFWTALRAMLQARATRRLLSEMDRRMLADIGVSPAQAHMEAARPFWDVGAR